MDQEPEFQDVIQSWPQDHLTLIPTGVIEWTIFTQEEYKSDGITLECAIAPGGAFVDSPDGNEGDGFLVRGSLLNDDGDWLNKTKVRLSLTRKKDNQDGKKLGEMKFEQGSTARITGANGDVDNSYNEDRIKIFLMLAGDVYEKILAEVNRGNLPSSIDLKGYGLALGVCPGETVWETKKYPKVYISSAWVDYKIDLAKAKTAKTIGPDTTVHSDLEILAPSLAAIRSDISGFKNEVLKNQKRLYKNFLLAAMAVIFILLFVTGAKAATDFNCVGQCTAQGYMYGLCVSRCSYDANPQPSQQYQQPIPSSHISQTDYNCVSQCTSQGYLYGLCQQKCSF